MSWPNEVREANGNRRTRLVRERSDRTNRVAYLHYKEKRIPEKRKWRWQSSWHFNQMETSSKWKGERNISPLSHEHNSPAAVTNNTRHALAEYGRSRLLKIDPKTMSRPAKSYRKWQAEWVGEKQSRWSKYGILAGCYRDYLKTRNQQLFEYRIGGVFTERLDGKRNHRTNERKNDKPQRMIAREQAASQICCSFSIDWTAEWQARSNERQDQ